MKIIRREPIVQIKNLKILFVLFIMIMIYPILKGIGNINDIVLEIARLLNIIAAITIAVPHINIYELNKESEEVKELQ